MLANFCRLFFQLRQAPCRQHHMRASGCKRASKMCAQPAGSASDQNNAAREIPRLRIHVPSPKVVLTPVI
jgi:hypothetical protein